MRRFTIVHNGTVRALVVMLGAALLAPVTAAAPAAAQQPPPPATTDVVFALDGSGSIDAGDWRLQRDGYSTALRDQTAFPLDGSVAVGVTQWSSSVRTEVPLTVIDDQADIDALIAAIQAIPQIGSLTNPGDGLAHAAGVVAGGRQGQRNVCMSTDGTTNSGISLASGVAQAQAAGVDKFSIVGIEDGGNGASLRSHYAPHAFGGGIFTLARNTAEFASLITGACLNDPVEVVALEVNQAIQNWQNTVKLVAGKPTTLRAFVQVKAGDDPQRVAGRLIGRRNGASLPGSPLAAANAGGAILAGENVTARRGNLTDSLNFVLPASWRSGTVEFELDGGGTPLECKEVAGPTADDCKVTVEFLPGTEMTLKVVGIPFKQGANTILPPPGALLETGLRTRTLFPVRNMPIQTANQLFTTFAAVPTLGDVNNKLATQRMLDLCFTALGCDTVYYGQLNGNSGGGLANGIPGEVSSGWDFGVHTRQAAGFFRNVGPHEVGHSLGQHHSVLASKQGPCGERAGAAAPTYPYFGNVGGAQRSLLGPLGNDQTENWGLDNRFVRSDVNNLAVVHPKGARATFDLMGYCFIASPQDLWPSDYRWEQLRTSLNARFSGTVRAAAADTTGDHLIVSGRIDGQTDVADIDPPAVVNGTIPAPDPGDYAVQLLGAADAVLAEVAFEPSFDAGRPVPGGVDPAVPDGTFTVPVLLPAGAVTAAVVQHNGTTIGRLDASPAAPTVTLLTPGRGSTIATDNVTFSWDGSDADAGTDLLYTVRFSPNGGTTFDTLALHTQDTSIEVPRSQLTGSANAVFQVQATDGLNVTTATSGAFTVQGNAPAVQITSPLDGDAFYSGVQQIVLEADATDAEDGDLSNAVRWTSNRQGGTLLTGASGAIGADSLVEGLHTLTAAVTDSSTAVGSQSIDIRVFRIAPAPPTGTIDVTPVAGAAPLTVSAAIAGIDAEGDPLTYRIDWGDGSAAETGDLPATPPTHTYTRSGRYTVTLEVSDGLLSNLVTDVVDVAPGLPVATLMVTPATGPAPLAVSATIGGVDAEGDPLTYRIDWGDLTAVGTGNLPAGPLSHAFTKAGSYTITLEVASGARTATATASVVVRPPDSGAGPPVTEIPRRTFSTDRSGNGPTPTRPVQVTVSTATRGDIDVQFTTADGDAPDGFRLLGLVADIQAPAASADEPIELVFLIDPSIVPDGQSVETLAIFRDGILVPNCLGSNDAAPDPCVSERSMTARGNLLLRVLTSRASEWTVAAAARACPPQILPATGFRDVPSGDVHATNIRCVASWGITAGSGADTYGPAALVTRGQLASFLARTLSGAGVTLPDVPADAFVDDAVSVHTPAINQLAQLGLIRGRTPTAYRPHQRVTRAQMATMLVNVYRAASVGRLPAGGDAFRDDDGSVHERNINRATAAGFSQGVTSTTFVPHDHVRRDQMASFLVNLLDVLVRENGSSPPMP